LLNWGYCKGARPASHPKTGVENRKKTGRRPEVNVVTVSECHAKREGTDVKARVVSKDVTMSGELSGGNKKKKRKGGRRGQGTMAGVDGGGGKKDVSGAVGSQPNQHKTWEGGRSK